MIVFGGDDAVPSEDDGPLPAAGRARAEARRDRGLDRDAWSAFSATAMLDRLLVFTGSELLLFSGFDGTNLAPEGERIPVPIEAVPR